MKNRAGSKERLAMRTFRERFGGCTIVVPPDHETMLGAFFADYYVAGRYGHLFDVWCVYPAVIVCGTGAGRVGTAPPREMLDRHRALITEAARADMVHGTGTRFFALEHFVDEVLAARAEGAGHPLPPPPQG